jgi:pheromone a factor receptor
MADNSTMMFAPLESPYINARSPGAIGITVLSFLATLLCIPPFFWHVKSRNLAASALVGWILLDNLFIFMNANIWPTDNLGSWWNGSGLCDVQVKIQIAATVGVAGALACIFRSLAIVLDTDNTVLVPSTAQRRRRIAFEIFFCFLFPAYFIVIHFVVQPSRFYLFSITGCTPSFDNSWLTIVLIFIWPVILCLLGAYYCCKF